MDSFWTHLSMQIFSTWGTRTCSRRMMVCSGSFDFQDKICESHNQSYRTSLSLTQSHSAPPTFSRHSMAGTKQSL